LKLEDTPCVFHFARFAPKNNISAPRIFWFKMPKLPLAFMLNNQNIKQKPIPSCTYLSYVLSSRTPVTMAAAAASSFSSSSSFFFFFVLYETTQVLPSLFFLDLSANNPPFKLSPTTWMSLHHSMIFFFFFDFHFLHFIFMSFFFF
jgi:hypothetical protein